MAGPNHAAGELLKILVGDGASPEVFAHPCIINTTRAFNQTANVAETPIPDCDDPSAPAWIDRQKTERSNDISGEGILHVDDVATFQAWLDSADPKNVKVKVDRAGGRTWTGAFHLTQFNLAGEARNGKITASIVMQSTGAVTNAANV